MAGGIGGGIVGRSLNKQMDNRTVDILFVGLMVLIILSGENVLLLDLSE